MKILKLDENDLRRELFMEAVGIITEQKGNNNFFLLFRVLVVAQTLHLYSMLVLIPAYVIGNILFGTLTEDRTLITVLMFLICMLTFYLRYHLIRSSSMIYYVLHKHEHEEWE